MGQNRKRNLNNGGRGKTVKVKRKGNPREKAEQDVQTHTDALSLSNNQSLASPSNGSTPTPSSENSGTSFFEYTGGVAITGGTFEQTNGHRNNVNIQLHVHNSPRQDPCTPQPATSPSSPDSHPSLPSSTPPANSGPNRWSSSSVDTQGSLDADEKSSNQIYEEQLRRKKRGFPLWSPGPNQYLPLAYRREGVAIGDVGIYTPFGGFSFIFSICLPRNHPIQPRDLPDDFEPISPSINPRELRKYLEFTPGSHLASKAIKKITTDDSPDVDLTFETTESEGAILTLPEGAVAYDLQNKFRIEKYAAENIESWYSYINGTCGCQAKNGDVRLVIGCDKTSSWGMAVINSPAQHTHHRLRYRPIVSDASSTSSSSFSSSTTLNQIYKWDSSGYADARVGPYPEEIDPLIDNEDSGAAITGHYPNQCLFVRTLNLMLRDDIFASINKELGLVLTDEQSSFTSTNYVSTNSSSSCINEPQSVGANPSTCGATIGTQRAQSYIRVNERITMSTTPTVQKSHPADALNRKIFESVPECRVVFTRDENWCSVINEDDEIMSTITKIADEVLDSHHIVQENGVAFLKPKDSLCSSTPELCQINLSVSDSSDDAVITLNRRTHMIDSSLFPHRLQDVGPSSQEKQQNFSGPRLPTTRLHQQLMEMQASDTMYTQSLAYAQAYYDTYDPMCSQSLAYPQLWTPAVTSVPLSPPPSPPASPRSPKTHAPLMLKPAPKARRPSKPASPQAVAPASISDLVQPPVPSPSTSTASMKRRHKDSYSPLRDNTGVPESEQPPRKRSKMEGKSSMSESSGKQVETDIVVTDRDEVHFAREQMSEGVGRLRESGKNDSLFVDDGPMADLAMDCNYIDIGLSDTHYNDWTAPTPSLASSSSTDSSLEEESLDIFTPYRRII